MMQNVNKRIYMKSEYQTRQIWSIKTKKAPTVSSNGLSAQQIMKNENLKAKLLILVFF